jgi:hypothetical protein
VAKVKKFKLCVAKEIAGLFLARVIDLWLHKRLGIDGNKQLFFRS